jgi:8-oxo-dGTP pyrophosphatase MutT (NUDIX family)
MEAMMDWFTLLRQSLSPVALPKPESFSGGLSSVLIAVGKNRATQQEEILLTKRTMLVESHKGQVSFPGGFWETHDPSLLDTALRESHEEIGANPSDVQILGGLAPVLTHQGVTIVPYVGRLDFPYPFLLNPAEVEKVLFLPLSQLMEDGLKTVSISVGSARVMSLGIQVDGELVWGATARMLGQLRESLLR